MSVDATQPALVPAPWPSRPGLDQLSRSLVIGLLQRLRHGELTLVDGARRLSFGAPAPDGLAATVWIRAAHAYGSLLGGGVGLARAYADGLWDCDDPAALVRLLARNLQPLDGIRSQLQPLVEPVLRARQWALGVNTRRRIRRRVRAHYDLGNDLFQAMLDASMGYSCAIFPDADADLDRAAAHKMDVVCRKLALGPHDHLLEIGGGWGGLAIHAARHYGCRVTTTTISAEQHAYASEWVCREGLSDRVTVVDLDYRDLGGRYSRIVSIEMIEAIGWRYFDTFFRRCAELLQPDGVMLLQAIVTSPALYRQWRLSRGFANSVIFPGGCLPSVEVLLEAVARTQSLRCIHLEDITPHYVATLRSWRQRFLTHWHRLDHRRYDERFRRLWEFYLAYCEGAFAERRIRDVQLLLVGPEVRNEAALLGQVRELAPGRAALGAAG